MAVSPLCLFLESQGHWKICAALRDTHPIHASLWSTDRIIHAIPHLIGKQGIWKLPYTRNFLFSLQAKPSLGYTGTNASAISRTARVADQPRRQLKAVWISDTRRMPIYMSSALGSLHEAPFLETWMAAKKPSQTLKQIRFLIFPKKLETLTPFDGVS